MISRLIKFIKPLHRLLTDHYYCVLLPEFDRCDARVIELEALGSENTLIYSGAVLGASWVNFKCTIFEVLLGKL